MTQELYGLPPGDFVAARNEHAKRARADGDRELAAEIRGLAKPTTAAWLVNQLSRRGPDDLAPLLDLGRNLRTASANLDGEKLRDLGRQRAGLVADLLAQAGRAGTAHGYRLSAEVADEVRRTLEAALSDSEVADDVAAGRLTRAVEYAGFGANVGLGGPMGIVGKPISRRVGERRAKPAPSAKPAGKPAGRPGHPADLASRRRQRAERELAAADRRLEAARTSRDQAAQSSERAAADVERTAAEVERLRTELGAAEREAKAARHADRTAARHLSTADRELGSAEHARDSAASRLQALDDER